VTNGAVLIEGERILQIFDSPPTAPAVDSVVSLEGLWLMPGFFDIHTHGAGGADVCDATQEALQTIAQRKLSEGVTTWFPTTLTLDHSRLLAILRNVEQFKQSKPDIRVPAVHLEGPYINPKCAGAQNPDFVREPNIEELAELTEQTKLGILSLAVEMPGAVAMVAWASQRGITCSLAHTAATYAQFLEAKSAGLRHLTHFCNQMTPLHHREIGIVGAGLLDPDIRIELICDQIHLAPDMLRLVFAQKPLHQLMIITDSMAASHLGDGDYEIGGLQVVVREGAARLQNGALAGSTLKLNDGLKNVAGLAGLPLADLIGCMGQNQAESLGLTDRGSVEPGKLADFAVLREDFSVAQTWVGGRMVYEG
jgi:N-acetylglucosamine-6-phosphate deacetylase